MLIQDPTNEYNWVIGNSALLVLQIYLSQEHTFEDQIFNKEHDFWKVLLVNTQPTPQPIV